MSASTFELDPAVAARLMVIGGDRPPPVLPVGDVESRRVTVGGLQQMLHAELDRPADVAVRTFRTRADDGAELALHWFHQAGTSPGSAVLYLHGGGMIMGSVALYDAPIARHVAATGVPFLAVEYRYAPEFPHPVPVSDCYAALMWLADHAESLGVDPGRIAVRATAVAGDWRPPSRSWCETARVRRRPGRFSSIRCWTIAPRSRILPSRHCAPGPTRTTRPDGERCSARPQVARMSRPVRHRRG